MVTGLQGGEQSIHLRLKDHLESPRATVRLKQVADLVSGEWPPESVDLVVGLLPSDGSPLEISAEQLSKLLQPRLASGTTVQIDGARSVTIVRENVNEGEQHVQSFRRTPTEEPRLVNIRRVALETSNGSSQIDARKPQIPLRIRKLVQQAVERRLSDSRATYSGEVIWDQISTDVGRATRIVSIQIPEHADGDGSGQSASRVVGGLVVDVPGRQLRIDLPLAIAPLPQGLVTIRSVPQGRILTTADFELRPIRSNGTGLGSGSQSVDPPQGSVATNPQQILRDPQRVIGQQSRRALLPGTWISADLVMAPTIIRKGDFVEVRVQGGGVVVRTTGKALADGAHGELISVETQDPKKRLVTRVADSGVVEILTRPPQVPTEPSASVSSVYKDSTTY